MAEPRTRRAIADDYQAARLAGEAVAMRRFQNEEACFVLLTVLGSLAADPSSFIRDVALKGGILMAGELRSPRVSADIDATSGRQRRIEPDRIVEELRHAGREFNVRQDGEADRTPGGTIVHIRFDSLTDAGTAKLEVGVREDPVFAVRDALFDVTRLGIAPFTIPALAEVELVAEKLRALAQRAQPRDLFDLRLYLVDSGWHLDLAQLRTAVEAKVAITRHRRWRPNLWRANLDEIETTYESTMASWIDPALLPVFDGLVRDIARRLRELRLD
jgi:predicted nucleotidyltransferase component of viral defense system